MERLPILAQPHSYQGQNVYQQQHLQQVHELLQQVRGIPQTNINLNLALSMLLEAMQLSSLLKGPRSGW